MAKNKSLSEYRTTILGYFLLTAMSIAIFIVVNVIFTDMERIIERVEYPSHCVNYIGEENSDLKTLNYLSESCKFSKIDKDYNIDRLYSELELDLNSIVSLNGDILDRKKSLELTQKDINSLLSRYNISIKEKIHNLDKKSFDYQAIKQKFEKLSKMEKETKEKLNVLESQRDFLLDKNQDKIDELRDSYKKAMKNYKSEYKIYRFKLFLLESSFILPLFLIILKIYFKLKAKDSQNTVIFSFILGSIAFLFIEVFLGFIINVLPEDLEKLITALAQDFIVFRYLLYYVALLLVVLIFILSVYFIQKMIFSKEAVVFRRLKESSCPNCSFKIGENDIFCANCSYEIRRECQNCKKLTLKDMKFCSNCSHIGKKE